MMALEALQRHFQIEQEKLWGSNAALAETPEGVVGYFARLRLHSHFQPLLNAATLLPQAHEALLRPVDCDTREQLAPSAAFSCARTPQEAVYLDRLCRVVHAVNFVRQRPDEQLLFLNVSARHLAAVAQEHGSAFERLLALCGLQPQQVVLEILESSVDQLALLQTAVQAYRKRGFRIAIDDFGCQHSNFDRLWQLTPDLVKLDRHLIQQADANPRARLILPKLIEIIHDLGASVVCEGIETEQQHQRCLSAGADLLQGFYYARPQPTLFREGLARADLHVPDAVAGRPAAMASPHPA
ncbi:putative membrane protein YjcC [compost metagenome]